MSVETIKTDLTWQRTQVAEEAGFENRKAGIPRAEVQILPLPPKYGDIPKWLKGSVWKTGRRAMPVRRFKSCCRRQYGSVERNWYRTGL